MAMLNYILLVLIVRSSNNEEVELYRFMIIYGGEALCRGNGSVI
jgi:hypothetical protein